MKKILFILALLLPILASAQSGEYNLTGKFTGINSPAKAYLIFSYAWSNEKMLDSATIINGTFNFKHTLKQPQKVSLLIGHRGGDYGGWKNDKDVITFYLEPGSISIIGTDSAKTAKIKGGIVNNDFASYNVNAMGPVVVLYKDLQAWLRKIPKEQYKDSIVKKTLLDKEKVIAQKSDSLKYAFIQQNPNSFISLVALTELAGGNINVTKIEPIFKTLSTEMRITPLGETLAKKLYDNGPTGVGKMAPNFTQNDVHGRPVQLSDFKGKYVLLDFWASWCGPCRAENPNVVVAYNKYKSKNFTVLGVSLDQPGKKEDWLAAIAKDSLPWTQVTDLQFWNNAAAKLYEIKSIPQNFLIDPNGKIIAKNLRGVELSEKLASILK